MLQDTVRLWQQSYFYVKNVTDVDRKNMSAFQDVESSRQHWDLKIYGDKAETEEMLACMRSLVTYQLTGRDITLSWMSRLMMPLQQRAHKMCFYSGRLDPTRLLRRDPRYHNLKEWLWTARSGCRRTGSSAWRPTAGRTARPG